MRRDSQRSALLLAALVALPLAGCASAASAPPRALYGETPIPADLAAAAARYDRAQISGNRADLEDLVADDYLVVGHDGSTDGKKGLVDELAHAGMRITPFVIEKKFARDLGSAVILGGWTTLSGNDSGHAFSLKVRFADVWARRQGRWQVVFTELTNSDGA